MINIPTMYPVIHAGDNVPAVIHADDHILFPDRDNENMPFQSMTLSCRVLRVCVAIQVRHAPL